jgi:hypothetical protein
MRKTFRRIVIGLLLLLAVATAGLWAASEYGQIEITVKGPNPGGTTSIWVSGGAVSSNWFTGGGGKPGIEFSWFIRDKNGEWVVADFGPLPNVVGYYENGVPVVYGERFIFPKRRDASEWPWVSAEVDDNGTPQLRKLSLWLLIVAAMAWPMWSFGSQRTNRSTGAAP